MADAFAGSGRQKDSVLFQAACNDVFLVVLTRVLVLTGGLTTQRRTGGRKREKCHEALCSKDAS